MQRTRSYRRHKRLVAIAHNRKIVLDYGYTYCLREGEQDAMYFKYGWDGYWSRRPQGCRGFGKYAKRLTHHAERVIERRILYDAVHYD